MKVLRTILAVSFAILVLVSSTSFMVGMHFCMGQVEEIALFDHADGCEKEKSLPPCHKHMKPSCCEDEAVFHEASDFKASAKQIDLNIPAAIDLDQPFVLISEIIPATEISRITYFNYDPPLRSTDLTVSLQVFLI